jgi:hypothetical protein
MGIVVKIHVPIHRSGVVLPLQRPYDGPFAVLCCGPYSFTLQVRARDEIIADSRPKPCMDRDTKPGSLRRRLNRQERARWPNWPLPATAVCLLPGGSHFQTPCSLHLHARSGREKRLGTVFPNPAGGSCRVYGPGRLDGRKND